MNGSTTPQTTGSWQCIKCNLFFDGGIKFYKGLNNIMLDPFGPFCNDCFKAEQQKEVVRVKEDLTS